MTRGISYTQIEYLSLAASWLTVVAAAAAIAGGWIALTAHCLK